MREPKEYMESLVDGIINYPDKEGHKDIFMEKKTELITVAGAFMRCGLITGMEQIYYLRRANIA